MKVAVTGADGFVGRHVVRALAARGDTVVAVSRSAPAAPLPDGVTALMLAVEDADYDALGRPDALVHLAWGGLPHYQSMHHIDRELPLHYAFLRRVVEAGLPRLVAAGTCYEYGMVDGERRESDLPRPANPYAYAKAALCRQLEFLAERHPVALSWARLFYLWGEGQAAGSLYPLLRAAAERGDATFPMSPGDQLRDYLPVTEAAAMLAALTALDRGAGVINISSATPTSVRTLVERWIAEAGWPIRPDLGRYPHPVHEPLAFWGSTAKRHRLLES